MIMTKVIASKMIIRKKMIMKLTLIFISMCPLPIQKIWKYEASTSASMSWHKIIKRAIVVI